MPEERRFVRTRKGRLVAGVCSGLGAQLGVDPLLLRIAFVGLAFLGGAGFWLYVAIFLLTPEEGATRAPIRLRRSAWPRVAGVLAVVVAIGIALSSVHWLTNATPGLIAAFVLLAFIAVVARGSPATSPPPPPSPPTSDCSRSRARGSRASTVAPPRGPSSPPAPC